MSGKNEHHCRIGKVTYKKNLLAITPKKKAPGRTRGLFVEIITAIDQNAEKGVVPIVGFVGVVNTDGTVTVTSRVNKEPNEKTLAEINWRHLAMLFEDMSQNCRNFSLYEQVTEYDKVDMVDDESPSDAE